MPQRLTSLGNSAEPDDEIFLVNVVQLLRQVAAMQQKNDRLREALSDRDAKAS